ncbi:hypothetical protein A2Z22_02835 [Candidatus Woesebacteria bacterium RBG_16_34_12]|uniref:Uncharacterized protein n=1 Tax=Candidatus Woesebacteria bacterium RBG_16_34_12 TaxID=1802480 RepID=A0A1F7X6Z2_9BACT|nr:MAG: hypothetical protein A2Z22_02835 [Candidatus Woesebacteria bacterium RBG_16_34_12]
MKDAIAQIIGPVNPPPGVSNYGLAFSGPGITNFISNIIKLLIVIAGIYAVINLILAGLSFMGAGGDPQKVANARSKIWQTLIGLVISVGALVLAAIFGLILFGDAFFFLSLRVYGPT